MTIEVFVTISEGSDAGMRVHPSAKQLRVKSSPIEANKWVNCVIQLSRSGEGASDSTASDSDPVGNGGGTLPDHRNRWKPKVRPSNMTLSLRFQGKMEGSISGSVGR